MLYIVIARGQGFIMAVNEPSPRVKPEDKDCLLNLIALATFINIIEVSGGAC
jgi:hypothetical protein